MVKVMDDFLVITKIIYEMTSNHLYRGDVLGSVVFGQNRCY